MKRINNQKVFERADCRCGDNPCSCNDVPGSPAPNLAQTFDPHVFHEGDAEYIAWSQRERRHERVGRYPRLQEDY